MRKVILSLIFVAAVGASLYYGYNYSKKDNLSYITISINPEVLLSVNLEGKVVEVTGVNEDADVLLSNINLIGLTAEEASSLIVDAATEAGYIDEYSSENAITITTVNEEEQERTKLQDRVVNHLNIYLENKKVYAVLVAKELDGKLKAEAEAYNISNGKMLLIEEVVVLDSTLEKKSLVDMTIREIQELIKEKVKTRHEALNEDIEVLKEEWLQKKDALKEETKAKIEQVQANIQNNIENLNSLTPTERAEKVNEAIQTKKEEVKTIFDSVKDQIREAIKNRQFNPDTQNNDSGFYSSEQEQR